MPVSASSSLRARESAGVTVDTSKRTIDMSGFKHGRVLLTNLGNVSVYYEMADTTPTSITFNTSGESGKSPMIPPKSSIKVDRQGSDTLSAITESGSSQLVAQDVEELKR